MCIIMAFDTHLLQSLAPPMRTNIVIDDDLLARAMAATGARTKREAVELGLAALVKLDQQSQIRQLRGRLTWCDDLDEMRRDR